MRKILLNKGKGKQSVNNENIIPIEFNRDISLFNDEILSETIDTLEVYNNEKNNSDKHRFIFTINPVCSNVLFNKLTEVVYKEGSDECVNLNKDTKIFNKAISKETVNTLQAIRNTEYSNDIYELTYHCGIDIFNNHLLRSKGSVNVQRRDSGATQECVIKNEKEETVKNNYDSFNTIGDYARNFKGEDILEILPNSNKNYTFEGSSFKPSPLYIHDTIMSFGDAYKNGIAKKDGWIGFNNKSVLNMSVGKMTINTSVKNFEITDNQTATPTTYKVRMGSLNFNDNNSFQTEIKDNTHSNLTPGYNNGYYTGTTSGGNYTTGSTNNGETNFPIVDWGNLDQGLVTSFNITTKIEEYYVNKCINNKESGTFIDFTPERDLFYFTPKKNPYRNRLEYNWDCFLTYPSKSIYSTNFSNGDREKELLLGKNEGQPLIGFTKADKYREYYGNNNLKLVMFRSAVKHNLQKGDIVNIKFTNNKNIKCTVINLGTLEGKYQDRYFSVQLDDFIDYIDSTDIAERFTKVVNGFECEYYLRKFTKIGKVINDKIQTPKSVLNRLAFANTIYGDETSQLIYVDDVNINDYKDNRGRPLTEVYLTILKANRGNTLWYNSGNYKSSQIEYSHVFGKVSSGLDLPDYVNNEFNLPTLRYQHNITDSDILKEIELNESSKKLENDILNTNNEFYGDLIEFNPITLTETVLEDVMHRVNTGQRELTGNRNIYKTIKYDELYGDIYDSSIDKNVFYEHSLNEGIANLGPEGYIYKPHFKIKIGQFEDIVNQSSDTVMDIYDLKLENNKFTFNTYTNYGLMPNDLISFMDENGNLYKLRVNSYIINSSSKIYKCEANNITNLTQIPNKAVFFKHNLEIPEYAYMLPDGSGRHLWKDIIKPSDYTSIDELYDTPFTNGAFYHHTNINFFVRRQDPFGNFGMFVKKGGIPLENNFDIQAEEIDLSPDEYISKPEKNSCF